MLEEEISLRDLKQKRKIRLNINLTHLFADKPIISSYNLLTSIYLRTSLL